MSEIVERRFDILRSSISYLLLFLFFAQISIDYKETNIFSCLIILGVSFVVVKYCFRPGIFIGNPLSMVSLIGYWVAVQFGPLVYQTITFNSMTEGLHDGVKVFGVTGLFLVSLIIGNLIYRRSDLLQSVRAKIQSSVLEPIGLFVQPTEVILYSMGMIGLLSLALTGAHDEGAAYGNVSSKFVEAFRVFVYAPFARAIVPGVRDEGRGIFPKVDRGIIFYVIALLAVGMLRNARGLMIIGILALTINSALMMAQSEDKIKLKITNLVFLAMAAIPLVIMFTYLAEAMAAVRGCGLIYRQFRCFRKR